ncbi:MAG: glycosyltransferase family 39 protein [Acidobacteriota bacterium]
MRSEAAPEVGAALAGNDARRATLALLVLSATILFAQFWRVDLYDDPALYASIARQMLDTGEWWTPHWGPEPYFRKPPLLLWLTALNFRLLGPSPGAAAVWPAAAAVIAVLLTYRLARRWFGEWVGLWAGIVLATTPRFVKNAFSLRLDSSLTCLFLASSLAALAASRGRPRLYLAAGTFTGMAILVKGPAGLIGLAPFAFLIVFRDPEAAPWWRRGTAWAGLALAAVLPGIWYGSMLYRHGELFRDTVLLWEGAGHLLEARSPSPPGTYARALLHYYWPWLPFLGLGIVAYARRLAARGWRWEGGYPAAFVLVYGGLLMAAATKHYRYLQPAYPLLAMATALPLSRLVPERRRGAVLRGVTVGGLVLLLVVNLLPIRLHARRNGTLETVARDLGKAGRQVAVTGEAADHNLLSVLLFHGGVVAREMEPRLMPSPPPTDPCYFLFYRPAEEAAVRSAHTLSGVISFDVDRLPLKMAWACRREGLKGDGPFR